MATIVGQRSGLFFKKVAGGLPVIQDAAVQTGNIFFVDSNAANAGDSAGKGTHPDYPFATAAYAVSQCTANQGDEVLCAPGHAETLAAVATLSKAGVRVIGLGDGNTRPAFTVNAVADGISLEAADMILENVRFPTPTAAATALINMAAARCVVRKCGFVLGANVVDAITVTAAGELPTIEDCDVIVTADGPDSWIKFEGVVDLPQIRNNTVVGSDGTNAFDDGVIDFDSVAVTNPMVYGNRFDGADQATTVAANVGALVGALIGPNTYAGSATSADNVSSQQEIIDRIGTLSNSGGTATLGGILGDFANDTLVARLNDLGSNVDSATTDNLQGKIGTDTELADRSVYDILNGGGPAAAAAAAAPANDVSLYAANRDIWDAVRNGTGGSEPGADKSIVDAIGFDGAAAVASSAGMLRTAAGTRIVVNKVIAGTAIDSGAPTDVTGVVGTGAIYVEEIILSTSTGLDTATNLNVVVNGNTYGPATVAAEAIASLGANVTVKATAAGVTTLKPFLLEVGAKLQVQATVMDVGAGSLQVTILGVRSADGASLAAAA